MENEKINQNEVNSNRFLDEENEVYDREKCCRILGLPADTDDNSIKTKYGALLRQYKKKVDEYGTTYDDLAYYRRITKAYDTIFGFTHDFGDDNPTSPIPYKYRRKWGKFIAWLDNYRLLVVLGIVIVFLAVMFTIQLTRHGGPDIIIKFVGAYTQNLSGSITKELNEKSEVFDNSQITFFTVTTESSLLDNNARTGAESFLAQLMAKGELDVVLIDKESFDVYVTQYAFLKLDDFVNEYYSKTKNYGLKTLSFESEPDESGEVLVESGIYGIDISNTTFFEGTSLEWLYDEKSGQEKTMIFAIARKTENADNAWLFLEELLD